LWFVFGGGYFGYIPNESIWLHINKQGFFEITNWIFSFRIGMGKWKTLFDSYPEGKEGTWTPLLPGWIWASLFA
jgi:hypothetical protein